MDDLWPDLIIEPAHTRPPVAALKEQAAILGRKTGQLAIGDVVQLRRQDTSKFAYVFDIASPSLSYTFRAFQIEYGIEMYPAELLLDESIMFPLGPNEARDLIGRIEVIVHSEDELKEALRKIFSSSKIVRVIQGIMAQATKGE